VGSALVTVTNLLLYLEVQEFRKPVSPWQSFEQTYSFIFFVHSENRLFARNAQCNMDKIFLSYGDDISSSCNMISFVSDMFLNDIITYDIIVLMFT